MHICFDFGYPICMMKKFILCGTLGWCLEILFTAFDSFRRREMKLKGNTSIWMFPIYGMGAFIVPLFQLCKKKGILFRGTVYTIAIFLIEFFSGSLLKKHHMCPWDYSHAGTNIKGVIRLDYAPLWFLTGLLFESILLKHKSKE